jgi:hypothetical protein
MNNSLIVRENGKLAFQSRYGLNGPESLNLLREDAKSPQGDSEFSIPSSFLQAKRVCPSELFIISSCSLMKALWLSP